MRDASASRPPARSGSMRKSGRPEKSESRHASRDSARPRGRAFALMGSLRRNTRSATYFGNPIFDASPDFAALSSRSTSSDAAPPAGMISSSTYADSAFVASRWCGGRCLTAAARASTASRVRPAADASAARSASSLVSTPVSASLSAPTMPSSRASICRRRRVDPNDPTSRLLSASRSSRVVAGAAAAPLPLPAGARGP
mmetsp:Transcript_42488/g.127362  ORF Transcript_42488/g.127362 Transcript_42488/m.127362 type:complete len:200 (+) Transcript_42488:591-1190(+)